MISKRVHHAAPRVDRIPIVIEDRSGILLPMFKTPVQRLYQTTRHLLQVLPTATTTSPINMSATKPLGEGPTNKERANGLLADKGIELLTFGTPNGMHVV